MNEEIETTCGQRARATKFGRGRYSYR